MQGLCTGWEAPQFDCVWKAKWLKTFLPNFGRAKESQSLNQMSYLTDDDKKMEALKF